jgi:ribosome-binding ATPase
MLSIGLVGLPNAGKSTLFNLLTKRSVPAENFPFTTIDPHDGIVEVPDLRVKKLAEISDSQKEVYSAIEFRDIAGLVKGASHGAGLGNQFLSHIREVDLILLVIRAFQNDDIIHVENRVNPLEDEEILMLELTLADQNTLEKTLARLQKEARSGGERLINEKLNLVEALTKVVADSKPANSHQLPENSDKELIKWRKGLNLLTDKPILRLANVNQDGTNASYDSDFDLDILLETSMSDMNAQERQELGLNAETGLDKMIQACFHKLGMATFLTTGPTESRSWNFVVGELAPQAAGHIHTDFEKKFIRAEVVSYDDLVSAGGWKQAIEQGKLRSQGKDYLMRDGDVVEFKIGA